MANKQVILSHSGKQHSYYVAKNLDELGLLEKFCTSSYVRSKFLQDYFLRHQNQFWTKRFIPGLGGKKVQSKWRFELKYFLAKKFSSSFADAEKLIYEWDVAYDAYMAGQMKQYRAGIFWGFQGSCYESLKAAKLAGRQTICELATAHVTVAKKILLEESKLFPPWADSISNFNFPPAFEKRLEEEPQLADHVFAASAFTEQTLLEAGIGKEKIIKLPLGAELSQIKHVPKAGSIQNRPLRLLFAGTVTQRKGIAYLLEAMSAFNKKDVELHIIGNVFGAKAEFEKYADRYIYHGPVSQQELFNRYTEFDALVLPTIFEGFALVVIEAMAAGLPVIATPNCMAPDIIKEDKNGYLVPIRNIEAIRDSITKLRNKSDKDYQAMSLHARNSSQLFSWQEHKSRVRAIFSTEI